MLGRALCRHLGLKSQYKVVPLKREDCDITDKEKIARLFKEIEPWLVIHSAAYTDVDGCERDKKRAYQVNVKGTHNIAIASKIAKAIAIYISTDYVFSGKNKTAYRESDAPHPISIYGSTKLLGERILGRLAKKSIIIRTSWLFGEGRDNFIHNILKRAKEDKLLRIVSDKYSSPTYVFDLARGIGNIIYLIDSDRWQNRFYGIYHITNSGFCSWYEYAKVILKAAKIKGVRIKPIGLRDIKFSAKRPRFSVLDNSKYIDLTRKPLRNWKAAVVEYVSSLK